MSETAAGPRFARTRLLPAACRKAVLAPDRDAPGGVDHALGLANAVLARDRDAPAGTDQALVPAKAVLAADREDVGVADHGLALASCRVRAAKMKVNLKMKATVDDWVDPGHRLHGAVAVAHRAFFLRRPGWSYRD